MNKKLIEIFAPAKINLFLGIIGERGDRYHELLSLVVQVKFGDNLRIELWEGEDEIECNCAHIPLGGDNLIMSAIKGFRRKYAFEGGVKICLDKQVPIGAGFGGGSSDVVGALRGLNKLFGGVLSEEDLMEIAVGIGSDCRLFFADGPVIMRGRGEVVDEIDGELLSKLRGLRVLIFKPNFSINTGWAYGLMNLNHGHYIERADAEFLLKEGIERFLVDGKLEGLLYNNFEKVIFREYGELGNVVRILDREFGVACLMSGSGSGCFCILKEGDDVLEIKKRVKEVLGREIFMIETEIL